MTIINSNTWIENFSIFGRYGVIKCDGEILVFDVITGEPIKRFNAPDTHNMTPIQACTGIPEKYGPIYIVSVPSLQLM